MKFYNPALLAALVSAPLIASTAYAAETTDKGFVSSGNVEIIGRFTNAQPSGIAALPDGRLVLGFPRSVKDHSGPRLATYADGHLTPFPNAETQQDFVSPLGMTVDAKGHFWVLDEGMLAGKGTITGAQKLFEIDPATNKVLNVLTLSAPTLLPDSHVNDVRIDLTHGKAGTAFITDTSTGIHPALIVVDLASGHQRRILSDTKPVMPEKGFVAVMDGRAARYNQPKPKCPKAALMALASVQTSKRSIGNRRQAVASMRLPRQFCRTGKPQKSALKSPSAMKEKAGWETAWQPDLTALFTLPMTNATQS